MCRCQVRYLDIDPSVLYSGVVPVLFLARVEKVALHLFITELRVTGQQRKR